MAGALATCGVPPLPCGASLGTFTQEGRGSPGVGDCNGVRGVEAAGEQEEEETPLQQVHVGWAEIEAECSRLEEADLKITAIDLSDADFDSSAADGSAHLKFEVGGASQLPTGRSHFSAKMPSPRAPHSPSAPHSPHAPHFPHAPYASLAPLASYAACAPSASAAPLPEHLHAPRGPPLNLQEHQQPHLKGYDALFLDAQGNLERGYLSPPWATHAARAPPGGRAWAVSPLAAELVVGVRPWGSLRGNPLPPPEAEGFPGRGAKFSQVRTHREGRVECEGGDLAVWGLRPSTSESVMIKGPGEVYAPLAAQQRPSSASSTGKATVGTAVAAARCLQTTGSYKSKEMHYKQGEMRLEGPEFHELAGVVGAEPPSTLKVLVPQNGFRPHASLPRDVAGPRRGPGACSPEGVFLCEGSLSACSPEAVFHSGPFLGGWPASAPHTWPGDEGLRRAGSLAPQGQAQSCGSFEVGMIYSSPWLDDQVQGVPSTPPESASTPRGRGVFVPGKDLLGKNNMLGPLWQKLTKPKGPKVRGEE